MSCVSLPAFHRLVLGYIEPAVLVIGTAAVAYRPRRLFALLDPESNKPEHVEPSTASRMVSIQAVAGWAVFAGLQLVAVHLNQDPVVLKALVYAGLSGDAICICSLVPLLRSMANRLFSVKLVEVFTIAVTVIPTALRLDLLRRLSAVRTIR